MAEPTWFALHRQVMRGLPFSAFHRLQSESGLTADQLLRVLGLMARTLARRRIAGRFTPHESDRLLRVQRLVELAIETFDGDRDLVRRWLVEPSTALGGETPIELASTGPGAREVEELLARVRFGVFS